MRAFALALVALVAAVQPARAQKMPEVPCDQVHFRIAGEGILSTCRARDRQGSEGRWREELVMAGSETELFVVSRAKPASMRTYMTHVDPRRIIDAAGLRAVEDWGGRMAVGGYRAYTFTGLPPNDDERLQCLTFVKNPPEIRGAHPQIVGVYCRVPSGPIDEPAAERILERIRLQ
jgi:hypothetical protein